ncbi:hypothetical protein [Peribacillus asahii]|uniref:hypothetical protein n=1 Tax=Peribacillus asahii TaxID=228899 RepID=UPI0020796E27|nr:hypothetical protein [Peribacillus asahii]USK85699.1 hypothetical protein LIT35_03260 [Peribacillus asahii]
MRADLFLYKDYQKALAEYRCVRFLVREIDAAVLTGNLAKANLYSRSLEYSIRELEKLQQRKREEHHRMKALVEKYRIEGKNAELVVRKI